MRAVTNSETNLQTLAAEQNGNHIIFLRAIRSDNGKLILTRDDNIRIQDGVLTAVAGNVNSKPEASNAASCIDKNDNDHAVAKTRGELLLQSANLNISDVILPGGTGRRNANPVLFYTSSAPSTATISGTVTGSSDLTNGNVAFLTNEELQVGDFEAVSEKVEVENKVVATPLGSGESF